MAAYFAYGSNLDVARLDARVGPVGVMGPAVLRGWELRFTVPARDDPLAAWANIVPRENSAVWGVVYSLEPDQLERLDGCEGVPDQYGRCTLRVILAAGDRVAAEVYVGACEAGGRLPTREYLAHLLVGAREHGLPASYRARLERQPTCD